MVFGVIGLIGMSVVDFIECNLDLYEVVVFVVNFNVVNFVEMVCWLNVKVVVLVEVVNYVDFCEWLLDIGIEIGFGKIVVLEVVD